MKLASIEFDEKVALLPSLLRQLEEGQPLNERASLLPEQPGVYCFSEDGRPLYIGRTGNLRKRHKGHCGLSSGHQSAALAVRLARLETGNIRPSYQKKGSRKELMENPAFYEAFSRAKERIRKAELRFVVIEDAVTQALFEIYASITLKSEHNKFENT